MDRMRRPSRFYLSVALFAILGLALAACAQPTSTPTPRPPATQAPPAPASPTVAPTPVPATAAPAAPTVAPTRVPATAAPTAAAPASPAALLQNVRWLGQSAFRVTGEKVVYFDPYQLKEASPPPADIILITHSHTDHCSPQDVSRIRGPQTVIVAPADCAPKLDGQVQTVKPGDKITVQGVAIEVVPAYNVNKTFHQKSAGWVGYIVTLNGLRIYQAGDTDRIPEMDSIRADIALLPVGGRYTMTAEEAAEAANAIKPQVAVPMHWGSVVGSKEDAERFRDLAKVPVQILDKP